MKHLRCILIIFSLMLGGASVGMAQDFEKGSEAYKAGDFETALREFRLLAEQGNARAQFRLGSMYDEGDGVPEDNAEAVKWYRLAAEQGDAFAQTNLGWMYEAGKGVLQDYAEAVKWFRLAAEQGNAGAQRNLGLMYENGKGVLQGNVVAHMWYNIASANGYDKAGERRDEIADKMTSADISKAQVMARECMGSDYKNCGWFPLSADEANPLRIAVSHCWNIGSLSTEALGTTVVVSFRISQDGKPLVDTIRMISSSGGSDATAQRVFDSVRRAILLCGSRGFNFPLGMLLQGQVIEMTFDPRSLGIR